MSETELQTDARNGSEAAMGYLKSRTIDLDVFELLIAIADRKRLLLWATATATVIATVISFILPNKYTAEARILPPQQTQSTASMVLSQLAGSGAGSLATLAGKDLGLKSANDIYVGILRSRTIEDSLIRQFDLQKVYRAKRLSSARKKLDEYSDVSTGKEGLITIKVEDSDPKRAAALANAYVSELRNVTQKLAVTEASQRRLFFEQQLERAKDELAVAEIALKDTQQRTGMVQLDSQAKATIETIGTIRAQIAVKEVQLQAMRTFATDQNPDYVQTEQEIAGLKNQLTMMIRQSGGDGDPIVATSKMPNIAMEYVRRLRDVKYREAVFELLAKQFEAAKVDEAKQAALIQVLDPAIEPDKKSSPQRPLIIILCALSAFLIASVAALVMEAFERLKQDPFRAAQLTLLTNKLTGRRSLESSGAD